MQLAGDAARPNLQPSTFKPSTAALAALAAVLLLGGAGSFGAFAQRPSVDRTWERVATSGVLRVAIDPSYPPFEAASGDEVAGFDADLARLVAARLGVSVAFVRTPFDNLYDVLRTRGADATISALTVRPEE